MTRRQRGVPSQQEVVGEQGGLVLGVKGPALLVVAMLSLGCHQALPSAPPRDWRARIDVAQVAPACAEMIGKRFPMRPVSDPRTPAGATTVDVASAAIPAAIRALHPVAIEVDASSVDVVLGRYVSPGAAEDEIDHYGLVCATGTIPKRFQTPTGSLLKPLAPSLWAYDGVL